jgi:O-antigen/teichoic acid export membrane protein
VCSGGRLRAGAWPFSAGRAILSAAAVVHGVSTTYRARHRVAVGVRSRVIRSLYATGFGQAVNVLIQLAGVPLFLHFWGVEMYGQWLILSAIPAYLSMSDFGFASVAANDMTMSVAQGRRDAAVKTFHSTLAVILLAGAISGLASAAIILLQTGPGLLPVSVISGGEMAVLIAAFWGQVVVGLLAALVSAGYRCDGNFAVGTFLGNVVRLGEFVASVACVLVGGGFVAVAVSVLAIRVLGTCALAADVRRRSRWLSFGVREGSRGEIRRLLRPALAFMAFPVGNALSIQGFILVVGWVAGAPSVVLFSTYRTMTRFPLQVISMIGYSVWPELSRSLGVGDVALARRLHRGAVASSVLIVLGGEAALFVLAEPILHVWTAGQVPFEWGLFLILAAEVVANSVWSTSSVVSVAVNRFEKIAVAYLVGTAGALALSVGLGRTYGLELVAASLFTIDIAMSYIVLRQSMALTQDRLSYFARWVAASPYKSIAIVLRWSR